MFAVEVELSKAGESLAEVASGFEKPTLKDIRYNQGEGPWDRLQFSGPSQ